MNMKNGEEQEKSLAQVRASSCNEELGEGLIQKYAGSN